MESIGEMRVQEALRRNASALNLAGLGLQRLPASLASAVTLADLDLSNNELETLPPWLGDLTTLIRLDVSGNRLTSLPDELARLANLRTLFLNDNSFTELPDWLASLATLTRLDVEGNTLVSLPDGIGKLTGLTHLYLARNQLSTLPPSLGDLRNAHLTLDRNPLAPEIQAAFDESTEDLLAFLRTLQVDGEFIREAKLILVGEGGVGKSSLLATLRGEQWLNDRPMTHGIEVKALSLEHSGAEIQLNGWDFGGQPILRPTHQLFFTAPAVYLVVWNPRIGPERSYVEDWIRLIKHRAGGSARVHVVATHASSELRSPHLSESDLRSEFGDMLAGFQHVDSHTGVGIDALRAAIAASAASLPHVGRWYPASWRRVRQTMRSGGLAYVSYAAYARVAADYGLSSVSASSMARIANALGHWIYYGDDPSISDLLILKPDWLSTAISLVLDDPETSRSHGLLPHRRLATLWNDPKRSNRYPPHLYVAFLQLMEKFEISYRIPRRSGGDEPTSLIAQLVPNAKPDLTAWAGYQPGLALMTQICEIVDAESREPTTPEGLMYQLIVRFHALSLGKRDYASSVHWQGGLMLDDSYNGLALISSHGNLVKIQVRAAYPQFLLNRLTHEIRRHIESFWRGLEVHVLVPCQTDCGRGTPGVGLFEISHLMASRAEGHLSYPCSRCAKWLDIDRLLVNTEPGTDDRNRLVRAVQEAIGPGLSEIQHAIEAQGTLTLEAVDRLGETTRRALSQAEERYRNLILALDAEARDGPRLFTVAVLGPESRLGAVLRQKIQVSLWCEHSRLPVHLLNRDGGPTGTYIIDVPRDWLVRAGPWIRATSLIVRALLPVGLSALGAGVSTIAVDAVNGALLASEKTLEELTEKHSSSTELPAGASQVYPGADGSLLRILHSFLRQRDPSFGGLERVRYGDRYLWVHPRFVEVYRQNPPEIPGPQGSDT